MTKHLWEVRHPYYCNEGNHYAPGNDQPVCTYDSWQDFFAEEGDSDFDMNLLFRWDWREADPEEELWGNKEETLLLFWVGQRKGLYRWSEIKVTKADELVIRAWLQARFEYLAAMWSPFELAARSKPTEGE